LEASPSQVPVNFIRKLSELLQFLEECINLSNSRGSDLRKLIRSMNFWGEYPWKSFDFSIKKKLRPEAFFLTGITSSYSRGNFLFGLAILFILFL